MEWPARVMSSALVIMALLSADETIEHSCLIMPHVSSTS